MRGTRAGRCTVSPLAGRKSKGAGDPAHSLVKTTRMHMVRTARSHATTGTSTISTMWRRKEEMQKASSQHNERSPDITSMLARGVPRSGCTRSRGKNDSHVLCTVVGTPVRDTVMATGGVQEELQ